jgi:hypothetical protein
MDVLPHRSACSCRDGNTRRAECPRQLVGAPCRVHSEYRPFSETPHVARCRGAEGYNLALVRKLELIGRAIMHACIETDRDKRQQPSSRAATTADTPEGKAEVIVRVGEDDAIESTSASAEVEESLEQLFAAIDRMPRKRLTKEEIDRYLAEERASWD